MSGQHRGDGGGRGAGSSGRGRRRRHAVAGIRPFAGSPSSCSHSMFDTHHVRILLLRCPHHRWGGSSAAAPSLPPPGAPCPRFCVGSGAALDLARAALVYAFFQWPVAGIGPLIWPPNLANLASNLANVACVALVYAFFSWPLVGIAPLIRHMPPLIWLIGHVLPWCTPWPH